MWTSKEQVKGVDSSQEQKSHDLGKINDQKYINLMNLQNLNQPPKKRGKKDLPLTVNLRLLTTD